MEAVGNFALENAAAAMVALQLALLPVLALALGMHSSAGLIASLLSLTPTTLQTYSRWEANYVAVLVMLVTWCMSVIVREGVPTLRKTGLIAFLWGLLLLASPNTLFPYFGWIVWWGFSLFWRRRLDSERVVRMLVMIAVPAVFLLSWTFRNYLVFEQWVFVRSNLGLELSVSNNPCAAFSIRGNIRNGCHQATHPDANIAEAMKLARLGEPAYNKIQLTNALEWIQSNPKRFAALSLQRFWAFWFPTDSGDYLGQLLSSGYRQRVFILYPAVLLSVPGLLLLYARNKAGGLISLLWLGCFPLMHYVVQFEDRYRTPIMWLTFLLAGFMIISILERLIGALKQTPEQAPR